MTPPKSIEEVASYVRNLISRRALDAWANVRTAASVFLEVAISADDCGVANRAWFLRSIAETRLNFLEAFDLLKSGRFYEAWVLFERIEIENDGIRRNPFYDLSEFGVLAMSDSVRSWQDIYPYKIFFSPEMIIKKEQCSICSEYVSPWGKCSHEAGQVYCGRHCHRIVRDMEFVSISLVRDPVQKYSVAFFSDESGQKIDHYDYALVKFVIDRLFSPLDGWSASWSEAYHPHELFAERDSSGPCPCNSGLIYSNCCKPLPGVRRPHCQISFERPIEDGGSNGLLAGYGRQSQPALITNIASGFDVRLLK